MGGQATVSRWRKTRAFLVATSNDIEALPPELVRKGRLDEVFFVDLPDAFAREEIFRIHLKRRKQDPAAFELPGLVAKSEGFSGAEIGEFRRWAPPRRRHPMTVRVIGLLQLS